VILYALLAGNLPFGQNLLQCPRFLKWNEYCRQRTRILRGEEEEDGTGDRSSAFRKVPYPHWFFPRHFSVTARQLLTSLLNPDPESRISVDEALEHVWLTRNRRRGGRQQQQQYQQQTTIEEEMELEEKDIDDDEEEFKSNCVDEDVDSLSSSSSIATSATTTTTITTSTTTTLEKSFQKQVKIETSVVSQQEKTTNTIPIPSNSPTRRMLSPLDQLSFKSPPLMAQHGPGLDDIPDFSLDSPSDVLSSSRSHIESGGTGGKDRQKESSKRFVLSDFSSSSSSPSLPMFKDLVKRSTRFTTSVPASQVMSRIHDIVTKDRNRRVAIDLNAYKLTIEDAHTNVQICTVRVFQLRSRVYMVDFVRGQLLDTFQFRRFYDRIRDELTELVKKDYTLKLLEEFGTGSSGLRRSVLRRSKSC
jgi:serine/threonine protein kinase